MLEGQHREPTRPPLRSRGISSGIARDPAPRYWWAAVWMPQEMPNRHFRMQVAVAEDWTAESKGPGAVDSGRVSWCAERDEAEDDGMSLESTPSSNRAPSAPPKQMPPYLVLGRYLGGGRTRVPRYLCACT